MACALPQVQEAVVMVRQFADAECVAMGSNYGACAGRVHRA